MDFLKRKAVGWHMIRWAQNDTLFKKELSEGYAWQSLPALFFKLHGFEVEVPELQVRSNIGEAKNFINNIDLIVNGHEIEIKSRNESFMSAESFPYPTILVDTCSGFDKKEKKPLGYIMISRPTGSMLFLFSDTYQTWTKTEKYDRVRKIRDQFYAAPISQLLPLSSIVERINAIR